MPLRFDWVRKVLCTVQVVSHPVWNDRRSPGWIIVLSYITGRPAEVIPGLCSLLLAAVLLHMVRLHI